MSAAKPDARQEILDRIRKATGGPGNRATEYAAIPREYRREGGMAAEARLELFAARLYEYGASVYRCTAAQIADAVAQALNARRRSAIVVSHGVPASWLPDGFEFVEDAALSYTALDQSNGVLTGCEAAVAFTGTIILRHGPGQPRRAVTLVPDYHLCVVRAQQVVETLAGSHPPRRGVPRGAAHHHLRTLRHFRYRDDPRQGRSWPQNAGRGAGSVGRDILTPIPRLCALPAFPDG